MRNVVFGSIGMGLGGCGVLYSLVQGSALFSLLKRGLQGRGAYFQGQVAAEAFCFLLLVVGLLAFQKGMAEINSQPKGVKRTAKKFQELIAPGYQLGQKSQGKQRDTSEEEQPRRHRSNSTRRGTIFLQFDSPRFVKKLPRVCMRCGKPSTRTSDLTFGEEGNKATVRAPLCDGHPLLGYAPLVFIGGLGLLLAICGLGALLKDRVPLELISIPFIALLIGWFFFFQFIAFLSFQTVDVTDEGVTVGGVSSAFVEAVDDLAANQSLCSGASLLPERDGSEAAVLKVKKFLQRQSNEEEGQPQPVQEVPREGQEKGPDPN